MNKKEWLCKKIGCKNEEIEELFKSEFSLIFLLIWSFFESKCFKGFMTMDKIEKFNCKIDEDSISELNDHFNYFYYRYQKKHLYKNLYYTKKKKFIDDILGKSILNINQEEKNKFLLYVVFRYRNNMFHGNKGLENWLNYKVQIEKCVNIMLIIFDDLVEN